MTYVTYSFVVISQGFMSSMSVAQLPSVDSPTTAIADLKSHFAPGSIHELPAPYDVSALSLDPAGHNLIVVKLPDTPMGDSAYQTSLRNVGKHRSKAILDCRVCLLL